MDSTSINEIEKEISALRRKRNTLIREQHKDKIGKTYHPPGIDVFVLVTGIKDGKIQTIEINNEDVLHSIKEWDNVVFEYECPRIQFETRLSTIYKDIIKQIIGEL